MDDIYTWQTLLPIFTFMFVMVMTPGPNNLMMMSSAINFGYKKTIPHMLGVGFGFSLMVVGVGFGLGALFELYPIITNTLKIISLLYLLYLAFKIATSTTTATANSGTSTSKSKPFTFIQICFFQWINPKAWIMVITVMALFVRDHDTVSMVFTIAIITILVSIISTNTWALGGVALKKLINNPKKLKYFNYFIAILLVASVLPFMF